MKNKKKKFKINKIIKFFIFSDLIFWTGWGLINPIFAIYIIERIQGGNAFVAGAAISIYWIVKSLLRIPFGVLLDSYPGEKDDYLFAVAGLFIVSLIPLGYYLARYPWHIYSLQAIHGVAMAMSLSGWSPIFTRHIDKGKEATEWGLDATCLGLGIGIAGMIGGWAVTRFGFEPVLIIVSVFSLIGVGILVALRHDIKGVFDEAAFKFDINELFQKEQKKL